MDSFNLRSLPASAFMHKEPAEETEGAGDASAGVEEGIVVGTEEMRQHFISIGIPLLEPGPDGEIMVVMPPENAGIISEILRLKGMFNCKGDRDGLEMFVMQGDPAGLCLLSEDLHETLRQAAIAAKGARLKELKAQARRHSGPAANELKKLAALDGEGIIVWFASQFSPDAKLTAAMAPVRELKSSLMAELKSLEKSLSCPRSCKGCNRVASLKKRIGELESNLPPEQRGLTEMPLLRLPVADVRRLMQAEVERRDGTARKRTPVTKRE